ncbi:2Fe-2S iron-sulfur cluster-binding protein [Luteimonas sp. R10]|uniref:(2Fe-2S)-binding protein n=1 Tax=Luteimonas sp. R10 TaxID=3108176 RepID=UPI00308AE413|nr:2Fe-2S iron-sulfur cluster-binding protein [Luteimonas sp. R10]
MSQPVPPDAAPPTARAPAGTADPPESSRRDFLIAGSAVAGTAVLPLPMLSAQSGERASPQAPSTTIALTVNGKAHELDVDNRQSLLDVLRESLQLTGTKKGCNQGACGACTVIVDNRRIVSCLAPAVLYDGASVTTIEGLARGDELHPLQAAFIEHEGFQCGYCTSGQIMSGVACIEEGHAGSHRDIKYWMSGNICRCGAYPGITAAIAEVAKGGLP